MSVDLAIVWAFLLAFAVLAYVILDGFDLGVGMLLALVGDAKDRDTMVDTIAPVWDGNETWLILGGGGLLAAFPLAYAVLLPALYAPLIVMLLGLVFRGVAFEYRFHAGARKRLWDLGFIVGSLAAAFCQGMSLGTLVQGVTIDGRAYAGGWFGWLTPFSVFTGLALVAGYMLLGAGWLILKTEPPLQNRFYRLAWPLAVVVLAAIAVVSLWTPLIDARTAARWFSWPNLLFLSPVPLLMAATAALLHRAIKRRRERWPFPLSLALFVLAYVGLGISLYPRVVPPDITIWDAAAPDDSLLFVLVGAVILLPMILGYTAYAYWVFRGKVRPGEGYH